MSNQQWMVLWQYGPVQSCPPCWHLRTVLVYTAHWPHVPHNGLYFCRQHVPTVLSRMNDIFHFLIKLWRFHSEYFSWWFSGTIHLDIWLCTQTFTLFFFSLFCFQPIFWQMAFLIGWCKENGNFIRKKHLQGAKFGHIPFFDQNTQPK